MKSVKIDTSKKDWEFLEKNEDYTCTVRNKNNGTEIEGKILGFNSRGIYEIEVISIKEGS